MVRTVRAWGMVLLIAVMLLTACQVKEAKVTDEPEKAEGFKKNVVFNHYFSGSLVGGIDTMVAKLNETAENYQVTAVPIDHESYKLMIPEALKSNNPADLYSYWAGARTQSVLEDLQPIDELWEEHRLDSVFPQFIADSACTYNGKKYMIPITQHYIGMVYNKKVFSDLGIGIPQNWEQFLAACETLKKAGITPIALGSKDKWPAQFWFDYIQVRTQPLSLRQELMTGKIGLNDPRVIETFETWKTLIDGGYFNVDANQIPWDTGAGDRVYAGEAGMTLMGTWIIGYYQEKADPWVLGEDYGFFPFPTMNPELPSCAIGPVDGIIIPANAQNHQEASEVIAFFADKENQKAMSLGSGAFAPSLEIKEDFYSKAQLELLGTIRQSPEWTFAYDLSTPPAAATVGLDLFVDFVDFPEEYPYLLEEAQKKLDQIFLQ